MNTEENTQQDNDNLIIINQKIAASKNKTKLLELARIMFDEDFPDEKGDDTND